MSHYIKAYDQLSPSFISPLKAENYKLLVDSTIEFLNDNGVRLSNGDNLDYNFFKVLIACSRSKNQRLYRLVEDKSQTNSEFLAPVLCHQISILGLLTKSSFIQLATDLVGLYEETKHK